MLYLVIVITTGILLLALHSNMLNIRVIIGDKRGVLGERVLCTQTVQMSRHHHHQLVYDVNQ